MPGWCVGWLPGAYNLSDVERFDITYVCTSGGGVYLVTTIVVVVVVGGLVACVGGGLYCMCS